MRLDPWRLSLAAAGGRGELKVARRPRVSFLSTGEEIIDPGQAPGPYQIFDAGTAALVALARELGRRGEAPAGPSATTSPQPSRPCARRPATSLSPSAAPRSATTTWSSRRSRELGLELAVESVNLRPGKPTWFGRLADGRRVLGLPGNPASALVCAELFLQAAALRDAGRGPDAAAGARPRRAGRSPANGPREHWMRARLTSGPDGFVLAEAFADQDSSLVSVFASADALVRRPGGAPALAAGALVEALLLGRA